MDLEKGQGNLIEVIKIVCSHASANLQSFYVD